MDYKTLMKYSLGGEEPKRIKFSDSAGEQALPAKCIGIIFDPGCKVSSLKSSRSASENIADVNNWDGDDMTDSTLISYFVKGAFDDAGGSNRHLDYLTFITLAATSCWAITE